MWSYLYQAIKLAASKITPSLFILVQDISDLGHIVRRILKNVILERRLHLIPVKHRLAKKLGVGHVINPIKSILDITFSAKCAVVSNFVGQHPH